MTRRRRPRFDILYLCMVILLAVAILFLNKEVKQLRKQVAVNAECQTIVYRMSTAFDIAKVREEIEQEQPARTYFDVPLEKELQDYIFDICDSYNVDPELIVSMIFHESSFRSGVIGTNDSGYSYGLMQIMPRWNQDRMDRLKCQDLLDPYQNVLVGTDLIAEYIEKGRGVEWALMAYNGGPSYADRKASEGTVSTYATRITAYAVELCRGL